MFGNSLWWLLIPQLGQGGSSAGSGGTFLQFGRCGSGTNSSWCNRINTGFVSYSTVLSSDHTSQGHLRPPGPGQGRLKQQGKETSHGPALPFLACVVASHSWSFVIHAGIVRVENVRLTFYLGLGAPTTGNILVVGCPLLPCGTGRTGRRLPVAMLLQGCCHDTVPKSAGEL